jgi:uncharacterized protein YfaS (alpha-2-macroglobulin family)
MLKKGIYLVAAVLIIFSSCKKINKNRKTIANTEYEMKEYPQGDSYRDLWKKVQNFEYTGLPKSALKQVEEIQELANKDQNVNQIIKTTIYVLKYNQELEEESYVTAIANLDSLVSISEVPQQQIIHSVLAELYWSYYTSNRRKFNKRTTTVNFIKADIRTWSLGDIVNQVNGHYKASLSQWEKTREYSIKSFGDILHQGTNTDTLRPTLYDFLAHRALDYFKNTEPNITKPAYYFKLEDKRLFKDAFSFYRLMIQTKDTTSLKYGALKIHQNLTDFHLNQTMNRAALVDVELDRLKFVHDNISIQNKDELYKKALENLSVLFEDIPAYSEIQWKLASFYSRQASKYKAEIKGDNQNELYKTYRKKSHDIAKAAIERYPNSYGAKSCQNIISGLVRKELSFVNDEAIIPNKVTKGKLSFRNLDKVYFRIVELDYDEMQTITFKTKEKRAKFFTRKSTINSWELTLPNDGLLNNHGVEFTIPKLGIGHYAIIAGSSPDFSISQHAIAITTFWSTNITYVERRSQLGLELTVLNRESGFPMKGVKANAFTKKYNYDSRKYTTKKVATVYSDEEGYILIPNNSKRYRQVLIDFTVDEDRFTSPNSHYQNRNYNSPPPKYSESGFLFNDRGIYRPGQTVYFKGLLISKLGNKSQVVPNKKVEVTFYDANGKEIEKQTIKTNEYGTVSGNFTTPQGLLNGRMRLKMNSAKRNVANKYIQVEEYKRPKFEVNVSPIQGEYKLGDNIKVEGVAKAFAGNMIDGGKVKYRVSRTASFPWWCWYYYGYRPTSAEVEIINGETITDEKGVFEVSFDAIADNSVNKKYSPTFSYQITADVTDLNGETRSTSQTVNVGYNSLILNLNIPQKVNRGEENKFNIITTNLNGEKIETKGEVTIYKLKSKPRIIHKEKWSNPDIFLLTKAEHDALFPNRNYGNKSESELEEEGKTKVSRYSFDTKNSQELKITNLLSLELGMYQAVITSKDKFGNEVKEVKRFTVYDDKALTIPTQEYFWTKAEKRTVEPGEKAVFLFGTKATHVKVMVELEHLGKIVSKQWFTLNNEQKRIEILIEEKHRGGLTAHVVFVKDNYVFMKNFTAVVPFTNKQLDITFETFRNKLLPGQKEKWKVNIANAKGKQGDRVMAEMLGTMYDASLDEFASNSFGINIYNSYYSQRAYNNSRGFGIANTSLIQNNWNRTYTHVPSKSYNRLNWFGMNSISNYGYGYGRGVGNGSYASESVLYNVPLMDEDISDKNEAGNVRMDNSNKKNYRTISCPSFGDADLVTGGIPTNYGDAAGGIVKIKEKSLSQVKARTNFNETAFFLPHLTTDKEGNISFEFEMPEALTKWKFLGIAHTKDMRIGNIQKEIITQKDLMVVPNVPRFLREGDKITISSKIANISKKELSGVAQLFLFDALTNEPIDDLLKNIPNEMKVNFDYETFADQIQYDNVYSGAKKQFIAKAEQSTSVEWKIEIPFGIQAVKYKIVAQAGNFTDGEENALPVLTNRMLVTESMPLPIKKAGTHTFNFDKLKSSGSSTSLKHHKVTLEYTSNPAWYVVQAMPYMMEYPYDCAEQIFTRFYANSLATHLMNGNPKIKQIIEAWNIDSPEEFLSNLEKNQELKAVILEQTPWVLEAENQTERKKKIAQLFDLNKMSGELARAMQKLQKMQKPSGGWPWFEGMKESRYITQYITTGMGHLDNLSVKNIRADRATWNMTKQAIHFLDKELEDDLRQLKRHNPKYKEQQHLSNIQIQYLYSRSFFKDIPIPSSTQEAFEYYLGQSKKYWLSQNNYAKAMIGLANFRYDNKAEVCKLITASLKETSIVHPELGMYWKRMMDGGYYWYQAPIETQALMIELFDVVANDQETVNELKTWLLKQKQTTDWKTTKATAEACYALLLNGTDLLDNDEKVAIKVGNIDIAYSGINSATKRVVKANEGTGYFKTSWNSGEITSTMGTVSVTKKKDGVAWGAMYWQYFEDLDKITPHDTPLKIKKQLFIEKNTEKGKVLNPISENNVLSIGDKIIVRIEIEVDRNMEYIHMKDMRASGFEPINVISRYKWQDGLGYYESTKDASTDFFMDYLPRGTYVFEYPLRASQKGNFSNGITSIQCMYAPEFGSHSEGIRVEVK